jgi:methylase of polypeptide subunit release factors
MMEVSAHDQGRQFPYFMKISSRELDLFVFNPPFARGKADL